MYKICLLLSAVLIIAFCIKKLKSRNKKAAPGNLKVSSNRSRLINPMLSKEIDKIKCKEIIRK